MGKPEENYLQTMTLASALAQLDHLNCQYACYYRRMGQAPSFVYNCERFPSASLIKVPILLAWAWLERSGEVSRAEPCDLDEETPVEGAGLSFLLRSRRLPFQDVLLLMISTSDNLCTNLIIRKIGLPRLNSIFNEALGLGGTELQRKMMDFDARARGRDNWITANDCIRLYDLVRQLNPEERGWIEPMLLACQDSSLLARDLPRDTVPFYHKTGSLPRVLHDWGFTNDQELFLLTQGGEDEAAVNRVFSEVGLRLVE